LALLSLKFGCELSIFLLVFVKSAEEAAKGWILIRILNDFVFGRCVGLFDDILCL
jgi:hypothetical protein